MPFNRRQFLAMAGAAALGVAAWDTAVAALPRPSHGRRKMYRLSSRDRRASNAAKKHNANLRFATRRAANLHRAHPGDNSRIVQLDVSFKEFCRLFVSRRSLVADLRKLH